ncbi:hypothetical protein ACFLS1_12745 [Verrucomicrobiota bacterium]
MLRKMFHKFSLNIAIATLVILAVATGIACIFLGVKMGLIAGAIAFVILDGLGSLWELLTYPMRKDIGNDLDKHETKSFFKGTKDNPTIR